MFQDGVTWIRHIISFALIMPVRFYQAVLSPLLPSVCKFEPSCSEYFIQAVQKHGPIRGRAEGLASLPVQSLERGWFRPAIRSDLGFVGRGFEKQLPGRFGSDSTLHASNAIAKFPLRFRYALVSINRINIH
ncbi:MAG: membrane protein insertion efficiency factor YidD [Gemmataceae bacterium]